MIESARLWAAGHRSRAAVAGAVDSGLILHRLPPGQGEALQGLHVGRWGAASERCAVLAEAPVSLHQKGDSFDRGEVKGR